jgi:hypothetical protein
MKNFSKALLLALMPLAFQAQALEPSASPEGAKAYIISPLDGAVVDRTFTVKFGLKGMGVSPAGVEKANTGHHHLLVDGKQLPSFDAPMGKEVMHFGGGQTEKTLELSPGTHTLQLILGNHLHMVHKPPVVSDVVTITVK